MLPEKFGKVVFPQGILLPPPDLAASTLGVNIKKNNIVIKNDHFFISSFH